MSDKALREQVLAEFIEYSDHHNNEAGHHNAIYGSEKIMQLIKEDRERVVKEARIDEWKLISESLHSAWLTASNFLSESRNRRLNELRGGIR